MKLHVTASPAGRFWYLESPKLEALTTQTRTAAEIPDLVRDLVSMLTGRPERHRNRLQRP